MSVADSWALMNDARLQAERKQELMAQERKKRRRFLISEGHDGRGSGKRWLTWREKPNGSLDFITAHFFRRSADGAAAAYERTGAIKGFNF